MSGPERDVWTASGEGTNETGARRGIENVGDIEKALHGLLENYKEKLEKRTEEMRQERIAWSEERREWMKEREMERQK